MEEIQIKVPGNHTKPTYHDYKLMEKCVENEYSKCIYDYLENKNQSNYFDNLQDKLNDLIINQIYTFISSNYDKEKIKLIEINLELLNKNFDINNLKNKNLKNKSKSKLAHDTHWAQSNINSTDKIILLNEYEKIKENLKYIENLVKLIIKGGIVERNSNKLFIGKTNIINIKSVEELMFLVILLILESKRVKKNKDKYSWVHENINYILYHEIKMALLYLINMNNTKYIDIINNLYNKFSKFDNEDLDARSILTNYKIGLFAPIISKSISKKKFVELKMYQKNFINSVLKLVNEYDNIINRQDVDAFDELYNPTILFNLNTYGTGKTTMCSIATAFALNKVNNNTNNQKIIGIFTLPSLKTSIDFASIVASNYSTWVIQNKRIIPLHKYCPQYEEKVGSRTYINIEKWAELNGTFDKNYSDGLNTDQNLFEQAKLIMQWSPDFVKNKRNYLYNKNYYKQPIMIFSDSVSTLELNLMQDNFKNELNWNFINIIDEFPATADCKFKIEENELLRNILSILNLRNTHYILMSASPTVNQVSTSKFFENSNLIFTEIQSTTSSFTQLFNSSYKSIHPFEALNEDIFDVVKLWDDTDYRFITPDVFIKLIDYYNTFGNNYKINLNDVISQDTLINAIKNFTLVIAESNKDIIKNICNLKINVDMPNIVKDTSLILTSGSLEEEIINSLDKIITHNDIEKYFEEYKVHLQNELNSIKNEIQNSNNNSERSLLGSKEDLEATYNEKKNILENRIDLHTITINTNLGSSIISRKWYNKYGINVDNNTLSILLSGLDIQLSDQNLNKAISFVIKKPRIIIDTITSMYGRNNHKTKNVIVKDPLNLIGLDTLKQALARAGRDGLSPCVVGIIDYHLLSLFNYECNVSMYNIDKIYEKI
jgi:hypothetical protein